MLENAVRICDAAFGNIFRWEGDSLHLVATYNTPLRLREIASARRIGVPHPNAPVGRMLATKRSCASRRPRPTEPAYIEKLDTDHCGVELGASERSGCPNVEGEATDR